MNLYTIDKLACRYLDKKSKTYIDALVAEDIHIKRGEITIILGSSGSGKSTFMEAISLMSDTIHPEESKNVIFHHNGDDASGIDLASIDKRKHDTLSELRFNKFCFIFQDTNIMENFNAKENVALPRMLKKPDQAIQHSEDILREALNLKISLEKPAGSYSGGQKQRFSFARAFLAQGEILFGDEPTGSLDKYNSEKLFGFIKKYIKGGSGSNGHDISKIGAVIVTHSIELALNFADQIIVIVKPERIDDDNEKETKGKDQKDKELIKGFTNPFFTYRNSNEFSWRLDSEVIGNQGSKDLLPPIEDNDVIKVDEPENIRSNKERLGKEIKFFLNNSFAAPQKLLVDIAQMLNAELKILDSSTQEYLEKKKEMLNSFNVIKSSIIEIIDKNAYRLTIKDFENNYLVLLQEKFQGRKEILDLITNSQKDQ